jgi:hypothetical protein
VPESFAPDASLSGAPLPERTAASLKAMTSGGSTDRPAEINDYGRTVTLSLRARF